MKWKHKYIIGMTAAAILLSSTSTFAAEDDDVVVFGRDIEPTTEAANQPPAVEQSEIESEAKESDVVEVAKTSEENSNKPEETNDNANVNTNAEDNAEVDTGSKDNNNVTVENVPAPITNVNNNPAVNNLNENVSNEDEEYNLGSVINFAKDKESNNREVINRNNNNNDLDDQNSRRLSSEPERTPASNLREVNSSQQSTPNKSRSGKNSEDQEEIKARFVKLFNDERYDYYLDRKAVRWINLPYSKSEYMADVWIRMLEKNQDYSNMSADEYEYVRSVNEQISEAEAKGKFYNEVDIKVLRTQKYLLEHYYIRPKTQQIQFLSAFEVTGRPQNDLRNKSNRSYDYKNWENLVPGSIEFAVYHGVLSDIGTSKASSRGHMTFIDMLDEYARIALN